MPLHAAASTSMMCSFQPCVVVEICVSAQLACVSPVVGLHAQLSHSCSTLCGHALLIQECQRSCDEAAVSCLAPQAGDKHFAHSLCIRASCCWHAARWLARVMPAWHCQQHCYCHTASETLVLAQVPGAAAHHLHTQAAHCLLGSLDQQHMAARQPDVAVAACADASAASELLHLLGGAEAKLAGGQNGVAADGTAQDDCAQTRSDHAGDVRRAAAATKCCRALRQVRAAEAEHGSAASIVLLHAGRPLEHACFLLHGTMQLTARRAGAADQMHECWRMSVCGVAGVAGGSHNRSLSERHPPLRLLDVPQLQPFRLLSSPPPASCNNRS